MDPADQARTGNVSEAAWFRTRIDRQGSVHAHSCVITARRASHRDQKRIRRGGTNTVLAACCGDRPSFPPSPRAWPAISGGNPSADRVGPNGLGGRGYSAYAEGRSGGAKFRDGPKFCHGRTCSDLFQPPTPLFQRSRRACPRSAWTMTFNQISWGHEKEWGDEERMRNRK